MAHSLIEGMTQSGKSLLAKMLIRNYQNHGIKCGVYDPIKARDWHADFQTDSREKVLGKFWSSCNCAWFFDEAGGLVTNWDIEVKQTGTEGRHFKKVNGIWVGGHQCHYIAQGAKSIAKIVRDQCTNLFLFATALEDCKLHAREWNNPALLQAAQFKAGEYFYIHTRFGQAKKMILPHPWFKKSPNHKEIAA